MKNCQETSLIHFYDYQNYVDGVRNIAQFRDVVI